MAIILGLLSPALLGYLIWASSSVMAWKEVLTEVAKWTTVDCDFIHERMPTNDDLVQMAYAERQYFLVQNFN